MTLRNPAFNDARPYGFEWLRLAMELASQEGVLGATDHKVSPAAAGGMRVDIAAGVALVKGDSGTPQTGYSQGLYAVVNDATVLNAVTLAGSNATLPRLDSIYLRANDSSDLGTAGDTSEYFVVTGTATSGATLDNRSGAGANPPDAVRLADVLVTAGSTSVAAGNVRDRRPRTDGWSLLWDESKAGTLVTTAYVSHMSGRLEVSTPSDAIVTMRVHAETGTGAPVNVNLVPSLRVDGAEVYPSVAAGGIMAVTHGLASARNVCDTTQTARVALAAGSRFLDFGVISETANVWQIAGRWQLSARLVRPTT